VPGPGCDRVASNLHIGYCNSTTNGSLNSNQPTKAEFLRRHIFTTEIPWPPLQVFPENTMLVPLLIARQSSEKMDG
jgi:hypothetical protein